MNCLTEASRPVAARQRLGRSPPTPTQAPFLEAGRLIVDLCKRYYEGNDESVLPRSIALFHAFENAIMTSTRQLGGSTNTVLHLLAAAQEAGVDFTMADIDRPVAPRALPGARSPRAVAD